MLTKLTGRAEFTECECDQYGNSVVTPVGLYIRRHELCCFCLSLLAITVVCIKSLLGISFLKSSKSCSSFPFPVSEIYAELTFLISCHLKCASATGYLNISGCDWKVHKNGLEFVFFGVFFKCLVIESII